MRYRDGELPRGKRKAIALHLEACGECRLEAHRLDSALNAASPRLGGECAPAGGPALLEGILKDIRSWQASRLAVERQGAALRARVEAALGPYLGPAAAAKLLGSVGEDKDLLAAIEPVLAAFLGAAAASKLVSHIVDTAIVGGER